jgi:hypothetical protein
MDDAHFDALARALTEGRSRRGLTHLIGGLVLVGSQASFAQAAAKKRKKKKVTPPGGCQRNCAGKDCGPDGCGGSCGECNGGRSCRGGMCECPHAAPHWCPSADACVPVCPTGMKFDPATCSCNCALARSCCECRGGSSPFCRNDISDPIQCANLCTGGGVPFLAAIASTGQTGVCGASNRCDVTCAPVSRREEFDACKGGPDCQCPGDLKCFQPLGGGPLRCGRSTDPTPSCGCTSHQQCADNHGIGAFCVQITGNRCTCGEASTFCATQA